MEKTPTNLLEENLERQQFESTAQVMTAMWELFTQVLQRVMECVLDAQ